jgi:hypothetical protein
MPGRRGRLPSVRLRRFLPGRPAERRTHRGPRYPLLAIFHHCNIPVRRQRGRRGTKRAKRTQFPAVPGGTGPEGRATRANRAKRTQFAPGRLTARWVTDPFFAGADESQVPRGTGTKAHAGEDGLGRQTQSACTDRNRRGPPHLAGKSLPPSGVRCRPAKESISTYAISVSHKPSFYPLAGGISIGDSLQPAPP